MRLSRADFVPLLTIVAGGVIGASFTFGALVSRSPADDVPIRSPADDVPMRSPDGKSSVFDECAAAIRLLGWVDRCPDVRVDGFDGEVDLSAAPMFTPMTVRPEIRNRSEVQAALMREYPPILRDAGIGGTVVVWFFITEDGVVQDKRVSRSSGQVQFDEAALEVADVFRFSPALNRDRRVQVWIEVPITFQVR